MYSDDPSDSEQPLDPKHPCWDDTSSPFAPPLSLEAYPRMSKKFDRVGERDRLFDFITGAAGSAAGSDSVGLGLTLPIRAPAMTAHKTRAFRGANLKPRALDHFRRVLCRSLAAQGRGRESIASAMGVSPGVVERAIQNKYTPANQDDLDLDKEMLKPAHASAALEDLLRKLPGNQNNRTAQKTTSKTAVSFDLNEQEPDSGNVSDTSSTGWRNNPKPEDFLEGRVVKSLPEGFRTGPRRTFNRQGRAICRIVSEAGLSQSLIASTFGVRPEPTRKAIENAYTYTDDESQDYYFAGSEYKKIFPPGRSIEVIKALRQSPSEETGVRFGPDSAVLDRRMLLPRRIDTPRGQEFNLLAPSRTPSMQLALRDRRDPISRGAYSFQNQGNFESSIPVAGPSKALTAGDYELNLFLRRLDVDLSPYLALFRYNGVDFGTLQTMKSWDANKRSVTLESLFVRSTGEHKAMSRFELSVLVSGIDML